MSSEIKPTSLPLTDAKGFSGRTGDLPERDIPLAEIATAVRGIRHGSVQIIIQDGVVVQIDKTEKVRLR